MNQDDLLVVIEKIYEAATDTSRWPVVLQTIADAFGAQDASLSAVSPVAVPWLSRRAPIPRSCKATGSIITR